jgi:arylsulfatase A-like enzyme
MMRRLSLLAALAFWPACEASRPTSVEIEAPLVAETPVAAKEWDGTLVEFGSPSALPLLGEGWSYGETAPDGSAFRWAVGDVASFRFESDAAGRRLGWIECQPHRFAGAPEQALGITLNGDELPPVHLREGRNRYPVELPLIEGDNVMEVRFRYARAPSDAGGDSQDRRRLAVAFYRFDVPPEGAPAVEGRPGPFAIVEPATGPPGVFLPAGGRLSFFLEVLPRSRLSVQVGASQPERLLAPSGSRVRVSVRTEDSSEIEEVVEPSAARGEVLELDVSLEALAGRRVELSFLAESADVFVRPTLWYAPVAEPQPIQRPNVPEGLNVLILVLDGASASRMSAYGYSKPTTPEIESFAKESVVFDQAISQAVYTIASIGSVLTGQYPERHQSVSFADRLPSSAVTLPGILTAEGFATAGFSGNAVVSSTFGLDRGYQEFRLARELSGYTGHGDSVKSSFLEWLSQNAEKRFFAYVHFREPHFPYDPPPPYDTLFGPAPVFPKGLQDWEAVEIYNRAAARGEEVPAEVLDRVRALYEGNLAYVDHLVGEVLAELARLGLAERTAVVLTADHGESLFEHRYIGHNTQLYEESVRVPLMWRVPGIAPRRVADVVELIDLAPTVLDLVRLGELPAVEGMQGRSLVPLLVGDEAVARPAFSRTLWNKPRYSVRDRESKYIWDSRSGAGELYDLARDPMEAVNINGSRKFAAGFWHQQVLHWLREQEHLRAGAPAPEEALVPEDLGRYLSGVGYLQNVEPQSDETPSQKEIDD